MSHERRIAGAASIVGAATAISRVLGYIRDAVVAYAFGAGLVSDAFFAAFKIANLLRRLVGEGALTASFIPIFTEEMNSRSKEGTRELASAVFTLFGVILIIITVICIIFSRELTWLMAPGFTADPAKFELTVSLTRLMFPYMVFIGLMAIAMGVLNSYKHFTAPALAPVFLNIAMISSVFLIAPFLESPVYALVIGVLAGGALQLFTQFPALKKFGMLPSISFRFNDSAIKKIFVLMGPATFGIGVYQLNNLVSQWFASPIPGAVSYLYYAGRLMEMPLGIFGVAISTAALPSLSEHVAKKEWDGFRDSLSFAVRLVNFVMIPATVGLVVLSYPIVEVLFRHGSFTGQDSAGTAYALYWYAAGLVPVAIARILTSVFYSLKDTMTPVWVALIAFAANVIFSFALVGPMAHGGLALANSLASAVNCAVLLVILRRNFGRFGGRAVLSSAVKSTAASAVMGVVIYLIAFNVTLPGATGKTAVILASVAIGVVTYVTASKFMRVPELMFLKGFFAKRRKKGA